MKQLITYFALSLLLVACQNSETATDFTRPDFINFDLIESTAPSSGTARKVEAYQANVDLQRVGPEEFVALATRKEDGVSTAYVLQQEAAASLSELEMPNAWVVFLQDHLLLFSEDGTESLRFSIGERPLNSPVINESITFTQVYKGYGLARYYDQQVTENDLSSVNSYLEARSKY